MRRFIPPFLGSFAALWSLAAFAACPNDSTGRPVPACSFAGHSLSLSNGVLDVSAPIYAPPPGNYTALYAGSASGSGTDDFSTLSFTGSAPAAYTLPQSHLTSFTGAISGVTLTVPSGTTIVVGDVITGNGVTANTYVKSGAGTSWVINNGQTIASETLTATSFPPGHGVAVKNAGSSPLTIAAAAGSTLYGAAGAVSGNPASLGGPVTLLPGGELTVQADPNNNYMVTGFLSGSWYQFASNVAALQWLGLSGYPEYDLHCSGVLPVTTGDSLAAQLAYGGVFQTASYKNNNQFNFQTIPGPNPPSVYASDTAANVTLSAPINNTGAAFEGASVALHFTFAQGYGGGFRNTMSGTTNQYSGTDEDYLITFGAGPYSTSTVTGIKLFFAGGSNIASAMCWLRPSI